MKRLLPLGLSQYRMAAHMHDTFLPVGFQAAAKFLQPRPKVSNSISLGECSILLCDGRVSIRFLNSLCLCNSAYHATKDESYSPLLLRSEYSPCKP